MSAINNRISIPTDVIPFTVQSGSTIGTQLGAGVVQYSITSTTALTIKAADFGLKEVISFVGGGVNGPSDAHIVSGNVVTDNVDGEFSILAFGPVAGS